MLLCIDIGNTNTVFGVFEQERLLAEFRLESNLHQTADEYGVKFLELLRYNGLNSQQIDGVIIASVVPSLDTIYEKMIRKYFHLVPLFVGPGIKTGINIKTDNPKQLGADILVGAVASLNKYGAPVIIIDMGTAITLFYVDASKELIGGIITPGIRTSYLGLFSKTSKLEEVKMDNPPNIIGKDTITCIQSGMIYGTASLLDGLIRKMKKVCGGNPKVIITGGEAAFVKNFLEEEVIFDENLLLDGLRIIYQKNKSI
jgi:type III pantothenate kinase